MRSGISSALAGLPFTARISSPARRPADTAGRFGSTDSTVEVATNLPTMNRIANSTIANRRFAPGPAKIAKTRFHVLARQ